MIKWALVTFIIVVFCLFFLSTFFAEEKVDENKVYYGDVKEYSKPAQLEIQKVLAATPEYQRIQKEKIKSDAPLYWILLQRANERIFKAITDYAKKQNYDLVGEMGCITEDDKPKQIPIITDGVIEEMKKRQK